MDKLIEFSVLASGDEADIEVDLPPSPIPVSSPSSDGAGLANAARRQLRPTSKNKGGANTSDQGDDFAPRDALDALAMNTILIFWVLIQLYYVDKIVRARKTTWCALLVGGLRSMWFTLTCASTSAPYEQLDA